ncbi:MAG: NAD(P)/FAD-dependent oxidoreductase [Planctomycetia bacterium]|nr:NAD(P)/FAD-dependent oxidoreductase [Planctomycetia bacterium]
MASGFIKPTGRPTAVARGSHGRSPSVAVIGAGPAGLTAAYLLTKAGVAVTVLEADPATVGGISRTVAYRSPAAGGHCFRFDIGGHRFFSKSKEVEDLWTELLGDDMLHRPRSSRIYYGGKFYSYPLKAGEALANLGILEAALCVASYARARLLPVRDPRSFEDWVSNQFGRRLFSIFFKTYTEKVWGMSCREISADWAAQRIKGLSLSSAIVAALFPKRRPADRSRTIKTLIDTFRYPRKGPGMMWEAAAARTRDQGGTIEMGARVTAIERLDDRWRVTFTQADGSTGSVEATDVISSAPLRELAAGISPRMPGAALDAAGRLRYRDFITVALVVRPTKRFDDNWIYIHEPGVKVGRVQNFGSWSPEMVPDPNLACYGLEYFCFEGDGLWTTADADLVALATRELESLGLVAPGDVLDGHVVRQPKAYPVYDDDYAARVATIRDAIERQYPGLHLVGRNGMHKYNNQDHAMMTAMLTARNILAGERLYDVWNVNQDAEYHEAGDRGSHVADTGGRLVPVAVR